MQIRGPVYFISGMFLVLGFLVMDYSFRKQAISSSNDIARNYKNSQDFASRNLDSKNLLHSDSQSTDASKTSKFISENFEKLVKRYDQISDDPENLEFELQELAKKIEKSDVNHFAEIIKNPNNDKKTRAIAIDVLAMSQKKIASEALVKFVVSDTPARSTADTEFGLKAQAIEGIASFRNKDFVLAQLQVVKSRTRSSFINGRADLAIKFVVGQAGESLTEEHVEERAKEQREMQLEAAKASK